MLQGMAREAKLANAPQDLKASLLPPCQAADGIQASKADLAASAKFVLMIGW